MPKRKASSGGAGKSAEEEGESALGHADTTFGLSPQGSVGDLTSMVGDESGLINVRDVAAPKLKALFEEQRAHITSFFAELDYTAVNELTQKILDCQGIVFFTGIGKSSFIAKKVAMILVITGTRCIFLAATDALHGDIGIVDTDDILIFLSKSGDTPELLKLVPYAKAKGAFLVALTARPQSPLARLSDMHVTVPNTGELQAFKTDAGESRQTPPATYTAMQMLLGDTMAVQLMKCKGLTKEEYAMNHPAGRIGKRLILKVGDIMATTPPTVTPGANGLSALMKLAKDDTGVGALFVVDDSGRLLGTFSDGDLRRCLAASAKKEEVLELSVMELMNYGKSFPRVCSPEEMAYTAMERMAHPSGPTSPRSAPKGVSYLPVLGPNKKVLGVLTIAGCAANGL